MALPACPGKLRQCTSCSTQYVCMDVTYARRTADKCAKAKSNACVSSRVCVPQHKGNEQAKAIDVSNMQPQARSSLYMCTAMQTRAEAQDAEEQVDLK